MNEEEKQALIARIEKALNAFTSGRAAMHVPPLDTDVDIVLSDCLTMLSNLYTPPVPGGWIKCSDRMPETYLNVLLTDEADDMCIGQLESHDDTDFFVVGCPRYKATHWMPLPAAPEDE